MTDPDVIVVGAGPTGLTLANELGLAGVRTVVVERTRERGGQSRALNLQPRTAEMLDLRGWLEPVADRALATLPRGHFAGIPLDYGVFDTRFPYQVGIPQARVERFLEDHLAEYGIPVLRGHELTGLAQDADGVTATLTGPDGEHTLRAAYLAGADGGRSRVRKELGVGFPGRDGRVSLAVADVELADDPALPAEWRLPSFDMEQDPTAFLTPLGDGVYRYIFLRPDQESPDAPVNEAEVRAALGSGPGFRPRVRAVRWASRFTDASRQAESYVNGRVLLAGDAAHVHLPAGGQGLNLGVQDAFNLGWKLAATVRGSAPPGLLGTYHSERHPVGAAVLENTRAQGLLAVPDTDARAVRAVITTLLSTPEGNRRIAGMISGLDIRYPMPDAPDHLLVGSRLPNLRLPEGRGLFTGPEAEPVRRWSDRVDWTPGRERMLVRPDGYVCWAGEEGTDELEAALERWFGAAGERQRDGAQK
ncbi:FAD-dependent monooxygenase [Streptomyces sp. AV19]|uniref:FAD-dependent monooxygenase n=1 Tax=Streptomyces sp. AV19 TaxID=2793068 RepID=UPI0018FEE19F|nr:FAD-dependent monooxygenase [Streptomyces sp. AV19]MBH1936392.1 FAD-dependent monooxygenase [Streptomyces sp. AV19]MDG4532431.1 FAD-dependent monooxygenase [Streptomyces sp. AV19]